MEKMNVDLGKNSYDIIIGTDYINKFSEYIKSIYKGKKLFIITDTNVNELYKNRYNEMFQGYDYTVYILEAGEKNKHIGVMQGIYSALIKAEIKRNDMMVAFGGGVTGDIAGFAAASYLRGINFIQIPTTIISQVDSSVGGKVGVDLPEGKNLVGAFYQPKAVLIDTLFLNTLSDRYFYDGFAEIVKYGCIYDRNLFDKIVDVVKNTNKNINIDNEKNGYNDNQSYRDNKEYKNNQSYENSNKNNDVIKSEYGNKINDKNYKTELRKRLTENINYLIYRSCEIKKEIVEKDEKENGLRMILNFGHTIGHAIEQYTCYEKYSHGEAIATGMADILKTGEKKGITRKGCYEKVKDLLLSLNLPVNIEYPKEKIREIMKRDKKSMDGGINFIFLRDIGNAEIIKMTEKEIFE